MIDRFTKLKMQEDAEICLDSYCDAEEKPFIESDLVMAFKKYFIMGYKRAKAGIVSYLNVGGKQTNE